MFHIAPERSVKIVLEGNEKEDVVSTTMSKLACS
jgi:hypothetical protein